jgi:hypothetical protein
MEDPLSFGGEVPVGVEDRRGDRPSPRHTMWVTSSHRRELWRCHPGVVLHGSTVAG